MIDKIGITRRYILDMLESGALKAGDKLPSARDLVDKAGASFSKVQQGFVSLVQDGVLETIPRRGTFVRKDWADKILRENITFFEQRQRLPWIDGFEDILAEEMPELRTAWGFKNSIFEVRTTLTVQSRQDDYMDLAGIMDELYPDRSVFYQAPFKAFQRPDGKLSGVPVIFSPNVIFFNPVWFEKAGIDEPVAGWTWEHFIESVKALKTVLPAEQVFYWHSMAHLWINFIFRAGGCLLDENNVPCINSDETKAGLKRFLELRKALDDIEDNHDFYHDFLKGQGAMLVAPREFLCAIKHAGLNEWKTVPLPLIEGGVDCNTQATDLICIRNECSNLDYARRFIQLLLSDTVQEYFGKQSYGIPIRKSAASASIDFEDPRDALFLTEALKMKAEYNINSPELADTINDGVSLLIESGENLEDGTRDLQQAVETFLAIREKRMNSK